MTQEERYNGVLAWFADNVGNVDTELHYHSPYELLVAVILSAQCTDKRVNMVTPALFERFPDPETMAAATVEEIHEYIKSISYPNNKAKNLHGMAVKLMADFGGIVPDNMEQLQELPGVGRKTANVVMAVAFRRPAMPVDTHVFRVANRIGLANHAKTPLEVEKQLVEHIPADILSNAHHWFILHGRYVCMARKPKCPECGIRPWCKFFSKNNPADATSR